jgi:hypothetical protein
LGIPFIPFLFLFWVSPFFGRVAKMDVVGSLLLLPSKPASAVANPLHDRIDDYLHETERSICSGNPFCGQRRQRA